MTLLGTPLLLTTAVLAVSLPIVTAAVWSQLRGGRATRFTQRLALVIGCQLAATALVAVALNDYGDFYGSWSSLLHSQQSAAGIRAVGNPPSGAAAPSADAGAITLRADPPYATRSQWPMRGRLESIDIFGASSQLREHAFIYLPPQYFQPAYARTRFPALMVMSGYPGAEPDMIHGMNYPGAVLQLIEARRAQPVVLVMLLPSVSYPRDTECTDVPTGPQAATFYFSDLPGQIAQSYRVLPRGWGAIGGSTGGYCAVKFAMLHPDVCAAAVSIQGYFYALRDGTTGDLWGGSTVMRNLNDLEWRLRTKAPPPISVLLVSSFDQRGTDGYLDTQRFAALVRPPMTARTVIYPHGGHNIATWRVGLPGELAWLIGRLPQPSQ